MLPSCRPLVPASETANPVKLCVMAGTDTKSVEIERKFVLDGKPEWLDDYESARIEQGYLAIVEGETEVRVRRKDGQAVLTVKQGAGEVRREEEIELTGDQFEALWPLTEGRRVAKRRYEVPYEGLTIEIDVFEGPLSGIVTAEVEFDSEEASAAFEPPEWLGREVTGDPKYANESLATRGAPEGRAK
jgi:adenylate cyclase